MATVSDVTIKYAARGAKAAQKADQNVRDSIQETAQTAREQSGTINRWMQRHQAAILGIAAATTGAMMAIIRASPTLSAEMSTIRLGFSLLAMQIGQDLAPAFRFLGDVALGLAESYRSLPAPVRTVISAFIGLSLALGTVAGIVAGLQTLFTGTFIATLGGKVVAAISSATTSIGGFIAASTAAAASVGAIIGIFGVWLLEITGILGFIGRLGSGLRNLIGGPMADFIITLMTLTGIIPILGTIGAAIVGFIRGGFSGAVKMAGKFLNTLYQSMVNTFTNIASWIKSNAISLITAAVQALTGNIVGAFLSLFQTLIGGSLVPRMFQQIASYIGGAAVSLVANAAQAVTNAISGAFQALNPLNWGGTIANGVANGLNGAVGAVSSAADSTLGAINGVVDDLNPLDWGSDLANEFASGISNTADAAIDSAQDVADGIANALGFDNIQNDRMARRWGSDLAQEFSTGLARERKNLERAARGTARQLGTAMSATPPGGGGAGGGSPTVLVRFERGAIRQRGDGRPEVNERNVTKEQGSAFNSRSNI